MEIDVVEQNIQDISPELLKMLLLDKTTKKYLRWGSDNYVEYGPEYYPEQEMKPELITGNMTMTIQPRVLKSEEEKLKRTRDKAEVFTPSWVCNAQNNLVDEAWFERKDVFNTLKNNNRWNSVSDKITFPRDKIWKDYVDARRMEISCGEAPYLVSRYDTVSGESIPIKERIGILDRKLRIVNENAKDDEEWMNWVIRAFQSCYGYDYSGDNVLLARENLLYTFIEYVEDRTGEKATMKQLKKIANIISWNIWQMNCITMTAPYSLAKSSYEQMSFFNLLGMNDQENDDDELRTDEIPCKIYDWRANKSIEFQSMMKEG